MDILNFTFLVTFALNSRYHMQMSGTHNPLPANKTPPTPMVQTPIITPANEIPPVFPNSNPQTTPNSPATASVTTTASSEAQKELTAVVNVTTNPTSENVTVNGAATMMDGHNRTVSQSSGASAPDLVAINTSAIISDKQNETNTNTNNTNNNFKTSANTNLNNVNSSSSTS